MRYFLLIIAAALLLAGPALAQMPPARSAAECELIADMALVARALDKSGIDLQKAATIMADIYAKPLSGPSGERAARYVAAVMKLAMHEDMRLLAPVDVSDGVDLSCNENRGDLTPLFGIDS